MIRILREKHETPAEVSEVLRVAAGLNRFSEPNFRFVWGWNRLDWIGGKWEDRDEHGNFLREVVQLRQEPKYFPVNRWHIERWMPPELYGSPRSWYEQTIERTGGQSIPALGPYPSRGDWEYCFTLETPQGGFIQLTPTIARYISGALEFSKVSAKGDRLASRNRFIDKQDRDYDSFADSVLNDGSTITGPVVNVL